MPCEDGSGSGRMRASRGEAADNAVDGAAAISSTAALADGWSASGYWADRGKCDATSMWSALPTWKGSVFELVVWLWMTSPM
jgi:hypothetical protein